MSEKVKTQILAKLISASDEYLASLEKTEFGCYDFPEESLWIWPCEVTRGHLIKRLNIPSAVKNARAFFLSDNKFSLFLNGNEIEAEKREDHWCLERLSVENYLLEGENYVALRVYQSAHPMRFNSGIRGAVKAELCNGNDFVIPTDGYWVSSPVCGFYKKNESCGWHSRINENSDWGIYSGERHPRYNTRSCFFKKTFEIKKELRSATLYITAKGLYEAYINGSSVTDGMFLPGSMEKCQEYSAFDLTEKLTVGENQLKILLGSGWLNSCSWGTFNGIKPSFISELSLEYENGDKETVPSDETWLSCASPILDNDIQYGERYDARVEEIYGQNVEVHDFDQSNLRLMDYPPVRIKSTDFAKSIKNIGQNRFLYDFGTNGTGRAKILLRNTTKGDVIKIRYSEHLDENGEPAIGVYQDVFFPDDNNVGAVAEYAVRNIDVYVCRGDDVEEYYPRFAFTGFRYVYVEGYKGNYIEETVTRLTMHTDLEEVGDIKTSDCDLSRIWDAVKRSYRSNVFTGPTDCPTREKNFWNGDIQCFVNTACWYMNNDKFLSRWTECGRKIEYNVYGWEDEEYILPLALYKFYGDVNVIKVNYKKCKDLIKKREASIENGKIFPDGKFSPYRDHKAYENLPSDFYGALYYTYMYREIGKMASILGDKESEKIYLDKFYDLKRKFNNAYFIEDECDYTPRCQGGIILPIAFGIAEDEKVGALIDKLHYYVERSNNHFTTGFMATEYILGILCDGGYSSDAYKLIKSDTYPSILDMLNSGATTTTENWEGHRVTFKYDSMNHYSFGSFARWFFEYLGGIKITSAGFKNIKLQPTFIKELGDFSVKYKTRTSEIHSAWRYDYGKGKIIYNFSIPEGTVATVKNGSGDWTDYGEGQYEIEYNI